ncbi:hypothetical protein BGX26_011454 [Mortierella sp. AD094]|nr:hypothetical protein BGX26_011454 [Mortierella sp. AD094]
MIWNPFSSPTSKLSLEDVLELANKYMENARKNGDPKKALEHSNNSKALIKDAEKIFAAKKAKDSVHSEGIANAYHEHGKLLDDLGHRDKAQKSHSKAEKWGYVHIVSQHTGSSRPADRSGSIRQLLFPTVTFSAAPSVAAAMHQGISETPHLSHQRISQSHFEWDVTPAAAKYDLPEAGERISSTPQLAYCLALISPSLATKEGLGENECDWIKAKIKEPDEQERLQTMATDMIRAFIRDELKKPDVVAEVASLAAVLQQDDFRKLLQAFVDGINQSILLEVHFLDGLAQLIRNAPRGCVDADDLVKILELLNACLKNIHKQSIRHTYQLEQTISQVLDSIVDSQVEGFCREQLHEPLSDYLKELQKSSDPFLIYQAAYAYQALLYVPDDESILQSMMRRTGKVVQRISGVVSAVKALDLIGFNNGLQSIQKGLIGAGKAMELVGNTYEDVKTPTNSGQGFLESLKEGFSFSRKSSWYPALRGLDKLIQEGRFAEFEKLFQDVPCRRNPAFQWGVCQRLEEIAANPVWDLKIRKCAISFMADLYNNDERWDCQTYIKQWILSLLNQLTQSLQDVIANDAQKILRVLLANDSTDKAALHEGTENYSASLYSVIFTPLSQVSLLLNRVQNKADVETPLRQLKRKRLKDRGEDVYISPRAKVQEFLESKRKVFLVLGDSGTGKSTFNRALEINLWDKYKIDRAIPLFIHLPTLNNPERDLIAERLRQANFTESQILELKLHRRFILICDGYDEIQNTKNLYMSNRLNRPGEWCVQMLISCRTEYNGADYKDCFQPTERNNSGRSELFQEASIMPFNKDQIQDYIDQYVSLRKPIWGSEDFQQALKQIPNLQDLAKNPFLLKLALEVLPRLFSTNSKFSTARITRVHLYDEFVTQWIERGKIRLREMDLNSPDEDTFRQMTDSGFKQHGITYLKELVTAIYDNQSGNPVINYSEHRDRRTWKEDFFSKRDGKHLLREAIPLTRNGDQYRFIHKSVLEYGLALAIYDPNNHNKASEPTSAVSRRRSTSSFLSFEQSSTENSVTVVGKALLDSPLGKRNLVNEQSVLQFLTERVKQQPIFKDQLHSIIERSKTDKSVRTAAANAITILVRAGVQFNQADLRNIKIPGADLSFGVFDSAQLEGADLRKANLRNIWMRQANLRGAQMTGVQFGELPFHRRRVDSCAYSPDGERFAVRLFNGDISLYGTSNWGRIRTLSGHSDVARCLSFSVTGDHIASGSDDKTVRLWDVDTGDCIRTLLGHTGGVNGVIESIWGIGFSPKGDRIASGGGDMSVRLWDADTGDYVLTLQGHNRRIRSVVYSSKGDRIASGGDDNTVRLWDVDTGNCIFKFQGHSSWIHSVAFSPKGDQITSGSWDNTVRLWDVDTGDRIASGSEDRTVRLWDAGTCEYISTSQGHKKYVRSVIFSPKGDQIASGSDDKTIRLWDVDTGDCVHILQGHYGGVNSVAYSPNGNRLASGSVDWTVRLWDVDTGECLKFQGHKDKVWSVAYSPIGDWIASGSDDNTILLWDVETGENLKTLTDFAGGIKSIAISPKGDWIASECDDETVQLWDVDTENCFHILLGHSERVWCVAYSPNGDQIATGGIDETAWFAVLLSRQKEIGLHPGTPKG